MSLTYKNKMICVLFVLAIVDLSSENNSGFVGKQKRQTRSSNNVKQILKTNLKNKEFLASVAKFTIMLKDQDSKMSNLCEKLKSQAEKCQKDMNLEMLNLEEIPDKLSAIFSLDLSENGKMIDLKEGSFLKDTCSSI